MAKRLRKLALTVDEDGDGEFIWAILESDGSAVAFPQEVAASSRTYATYEYAMRAGYDAFATLAQENPQRGPQREIATGQADDANAIAPRSETYKDQLIVAYCRPLDNGCFESFARIHTRDTVESEWSNPKIPAPRGGFIELEDAFDIAFSIGESMIDGISDIDGCELSEGGPSLSAPL